MKIDIMIFEGLGMMCFVAVVAMLLVMVAMAVDLVSGVRKAKHIGEARTSYGFSRTLTKFLIYEGILLIAQCIDILLHFGLHNFVEQDYDIPCIVLLMAIVLCGVEMWSVYERAEEKQRRKAGRIVAAGAQLLDRDTLAAVIAEAVKNAVNNKEGEK